MESQMDCPKLFSFSSACNKGCILVAVAFMFCVLLNIFFIFMNTESIFDAMSAALQDEATITLAVLAGFMLFTRENIKFVYILSFNLEGIFLNEESVKGEMSAYNFLTGFCFAILTVRDFFFHSFDYYLLAIFVLIVCSFVQAGSHYIINFYKRWRVNQLTP